MQSTLKEEPWEMGENGVWTPKGGREDRIIRKARRRRMMPLGTGTEASDKSDMLTVRVCVCAC